MSDRPKFPAQPNKEGGWTISFAYLEGIADAIQASGEEEATFVSLEAIEAVLLAVGDVEEG